MPGRVRSRVEICGQTLRDLERPRETSRDLERPRRDLESPAGGVERSGGYYGPLRGAHSGARAQRTERMPGGGYRHAGSWMPGIPPRAWHCRRGWPSTLPRTSSTGRLFCYETLNILGVGIHSRCHTRMGRASSPWTSRRLRYSSCGTFRDSPRRREASIQRSCGGVRSDPDTRGRRNPCGQTRGQPG